MTAQASSIQESVKKDHIAFQEILSDDDLAALFAKHDVQDKRKRKLFVGHFSGSWSFLQVNRRIEVHCCS